MSMVLDACTTGFIRFFFIFLRTLLNHWGLTISVILLGFVLLKVLKGMGTWGAIIMGLLAEGIDKVTDASGIIVPFVGTIPATIIGAIIIGILWVGLLLFSKTNTILKILGIPFVFVLGALVGALPDFFTSEYSICTVS